MSARSRFVHSLRRRGSDSELRAASRAATKSAGSAFGSVLATFGRPTKAIGPIEENKAVVGRWFTEFWGENFNPYVIGELAAPDIRFEYSLHTPCRGRDEVRAFATKFRAAFPDLAFGATADLIAEGDYVVGQWIGGGTQTGEAFDDMPIGALPGRHQQDDAVHRNVGSQGRRRPDRRGDRAGRRRDRPAAAGSDQAGLTRDARAPGGP